MVKLHLVCALVAVLAITGCASTDEVGSSALNRTGGITVSMLVQNPNNAAAYYLVKRDGTINFAGGFNAINKKITWTSELTDADLAELREILAAADWLRTKPASTHQPPDRKYEVELGSPEHRTQFKITGDHPRVTPLRDLLDRFASRRIDQYLDAFPKPGPQTR